jgi:hypothetical protein
MSSATHLESPLLLERDPALSHASEDKSFLKRIPAPLSPYAELIRLHRVGPCISTTLWFSTEHKPLVVCRRLGLPMALRYVSVDQARLLGFSPLFFFRLFFSFYSLLI